MLLEGDKLLISQRGPQGCRPGDAVTSPLAFSHNFISPYLHYRQTSGTPGWSSRRQLSQPGHLAPYITFSSRKCLSCQHSDGDCF